MNPQDQNTYVGPPPRAIDPNAPQDPYLQSQQVQNPPIPEVPAAYDPSQNQIPYQNATPYQDPNQAAQASATPVQPIIEPVQSDPNQYNTPQLSAQIQMAQQAGAQQAQGQTVTAQMMAQNPTPTAEPGEPAPQVYKPPLVISNSVARAFCYLAILTIVVAVVNFIVKQFAGEFASSEIYQTVTVILDRINQVAIWARVVCIGFAVAATVIRVYNPHPYNTKNAIAGWVFAILSLMALVIFR